MRFQVDMEGIDPLERHGVLRHFGVDGIDDLCKLMEMVADWVQRYMGQESRYHLVRVNIVPVIFEQKEWDDRDKAVKLKEPKVMITPLRFTDMHINWYMDLAVEQIERIKRGYFERNVTSWKHAPKLCPAWARCHGIVPTTEGKGQITLV